MLFVYVVDTSIRHSILSDFSIALLVRVPHLSAANMHHISKLNAFTCFVAFSWGEKKLEVGACCVQVEFWKTCFGTL